VSGRRDEARVAVTGLSRSLGARPVLHDVTFSLEPGCRYGLVGPNGAGKTTLVRCLAGILVPPRGTVAIGGIDPAHDPESARRALGVAADPRMLPAALPGGAYLDLVGHARGLDDARGLVSDRIDALDLGDRLDDPIATYSLGMRQKLSIVAALLGDPEVLVLDESLSNLDPVSAARVKRWLVSMTDDEGRTVLLASHLLDSVEKLSTRVGLLHEGRIVREWTGDALARSRAEGVDLEQLFVEAIEGGDDLDPTT